MRSDCNALLTVAGDPCLPSCLQCGWRTNERQLRSGACNLLHVAPSCSGEEGNPSLLCFPARTWSTTRSHSFDLPGLPSPAPPRTRAPAHCGRTGGRSLHFCGNREGRWCGVWCS
ncbi:uncharacterized protein LOC110341366 isoform X2 [Mesocricetus auratus]|uniref:Uncharacterized protein LOC110341366 isoform X2 n=1 Tax=Mesocricetus auratus TaxID=10036 RepID=A0ABM2W5Y0_MESAU|nr:uncharacterized protein LOC110341366 isoform X2 [Mesocricetus auratus]